MWLVTGLPARGAALRVLPGFSPGGVDVSPQSPWFGAVEPLMLLFLSEIVCIGLTGSNALSVWNMCGTCVNAEPTPL